jgi:hypothetical protein
MKSYFVTAVILLVMVMSCGKPIKDPHRKPPTRPASCEPQGFSGMWRSGRLYYPAEVRYEKDAYDRLRVIIKVHKSKKVIYSVREF